MCSEIYGHSFGEEVFFVLCDAFVRLPVGKQLTKNHQTVVNERKDEGENSIA